MNHAAYITGLRALAFVGTMSTLLVAGPTQAEPRYFDSPELALTALVEALENNDADALVALVGEEYREPVIGGDESTAADNRARAYQRFQEFNALETTGEDRRILVIGSERWPAPMPVVRAEQGWFWDIAEGLEEMLDRRIGGNELNAIEVLQAYVEAQALYASEDRDGDLVREYAQRVLSSPESRDGLHWEEAQGEPLSPFGPLVGEALGFQPDRRRGDPYFGYYYKVLSRQGEHAPGGRHDYVINGNMIAGFAMIAFPAEYGFSGIMTFMVNQQGVVHQKDLGEFTEAIGATIDTYDPDDTWTWVE